jgi:pyruvate,water dikinase
VTIIQWLDSDGDAGIASVGGKAASLAELTDADLPVPEGFAVTTHAYEQFLQASGIADDLADRVESVDSGDDAALTKASEEAQALIRDVSVPEDLEAAILEAYDELQGESPFVAVRSSATAEDLPDASFAGQQETFLNVDRERLIGAVRDCWASLFTERAIAYRAEQGFEPADIGIAVVVQRMVDAEKSGVLFTREPTGGDDHAVVEAAWGLGEAVVSGAVTPDTYVVDAGKPIDVTVAEKTISFERDPETGETVERPVAPERRDRRVLSDEEVKRLSLLGERIEDHYGAPQDVEWAMEDGTVYLLQSRPITTRQEKSQAATPTTTTGSGSEEVRVDGLSGSPGTGIGAVRILDDSAETSRVESGDVLVASMTSPDMVPAIRRASALVTDEGGMTSHAAIVARELGVPAVLGTGEATTVLSDGEIVSVNGDQGVVRDGSSERSEEPVRDDQAVGQGDRQLQSGYTPTATEIKVNVSLPSAADRAAATGADGVGLLRTEHMILSIGATPSRYIAKHGEDAYTDELVDGIRRVADAFYPRPVRVRTLDAPTDEFRELEGGADEPREHNPMLGYRGIRRSLEEAAIFELELSAFRRLYDAGYSNVEIMFPLVNDGRDVEAIQQHLRAVDLDPESVAWGVMIETPAAALSIEELLEAPIDFVSFGTNDLTQYTLAVDRNNEAVADRYDSTHPAVLRLLEDVIAHCNDEGVRTGICGEAASDPEMVERLVSEGIDSLSPNIDAVDAVRERVQRIEQQLILDAVR